MKRSTKQKLVAVARRAGLLPLFEYARFWQSRFNTTDENKAYLTENPNFSAPPLWWMHDMYRHTSYRQYSETGRATANIIAEKIDQHSALTAPRVADWGCGLARVLQHLPERFRRTGFDLNGAAVEWNNKHLHGIQFLKNELSPPLPIADGSIDVLYALSVFTHLSERGHLDWIAEIERVLAPGGLFLGAFHLTPPAGQLLPGEQKQFDRGEIVIRGGVREGSRTYAAYHPEPFLRDVLLKRFKIVEPPFELFGQKLIVARCPD